MLNITIITLLDDARAGLLPTILPRWLAAGRPGSWDLRIIAVAQDASGATIATFASICEAHGVPYAVVVPAGLEAEVWGLPPSIDPTAAQTNLGPFLHRIALMREAGRLAMLQQDPAPDYVWWLDSDIDPRPNALPDLLALLQDTGSIVRPRVACGLYCNRRGGSDISRDLIGGKPQPPRLLWPNHVFETTITGFGCLLARREVFAELGFAGYAQQRRQVEEAMANGVPNAAHNGEDIYWLQLHRTFYGHAAWVRTSVRCRHYHTDGSFWRYEVGHLQNRRRRLSSSYVRDEQQPALANRIRNVTDQWLTYASYHLHIPPGQVALVSREILSDLRTLLPNSFEVLQ